MAQNRAASARDLVITCVKGDGSFLKFWALPLTSLETVKTFEARFMKKATDLDSVGGFMRSEQIPIGSKCAVKSKIKNMWCRARVLAHQNFSNVVVQLMDYGNEEIVPVTDVRNVDDQIFAIGPQAVECILADVMPTRGTEWLPEAIRFCEQHLLYNTLSCYVVSEYMKLPIVRVAKKGENEPFVQRLINSGLAFIKQERVSPPPVTSYKVNNMDQNTTHLVKVCCIESAHKFYVQLSAAEMELKHLMDAINRMPLENFAGVKLPAVNTPCLAQLATKPCYYRALITFVQQSRCKVFFVDYGFSEFKDFQELRAISPVYLNLPAQAICCSLPRDANVDLDEFRRLSTFEHLECHVLHRTTESYVVKLLRRQNLAVPPQLYTHQKLTIGTSCDVTVSYVNDLAEFYIQLVHLKDQQNAISSILNSGYKFVPVSLTECMPGKPVCVTYSEDNMWYRAQIMKVNHENDIEVFFVDFGNYDNVKLGDVRKMSPELLKFPIQAYKCCLYETPIPPESKAKDDAFDLFEELTSDQCLLAHIKSFTEELGYGVTLIAKNSSVSINEKLISSIISIPVVPLNDVENVYITSFDSPDSFFAQLEKLDFDKLEQMQEEINSFYSSTQNMPFVPKEGNLVCARFNVDDQFYRARVVKCKDGACEVFFLDYGNRESITIKDIHSMDISFTKYPQFGIQCSIENCSPRVPEDKLRSLMLENSFQIRMVRKENDKWNVSLVENFPGNVTVLEMLRQNESTIPRSIHGAGLGGFQEKPKHNSQPSKADSRHNENKTVQSYSSTESRKPFVNQESQRSKEPVVFTAEKKTESIQEFTEYSLISVPPNAYRNVYISHVISPSEFYCQIEEDSTKLQLLMKTVEDIYAYPSDDCNISEFQVGLPCCAVFEDGAWYRGKIKQISTDTCNIFFVDYGNTDTVSKSKIKKLQSELFRWPSQAIRCKSFNISPKSGDWSDDEINAFLNMTLDKSFVAQFVECDNNGVYAVNLVSIGKLQHDIFNKEFVDLGYGRLQDSKKSLILNSHAASNNLTFSSPNFEVGSSEPVEVVYGLNPGEIFCQLKSYSKDFKQMMISLQDYYNKISEAESLIDRPHQGMICVAQFFLDSAWYRAEIKKVEANKIVVFYVDYGNSETVERKKVRCIIQDFTLLPVQAIKCRIQGVKPPGKSWTVNNNLSKYFEGDAVCKCISKEKGFYLVNIKCNQKDVAQSLITDGFAVADSIEVTSVVSSENELQLSRYKLPNRENPFVLGQLIPVTVSYIESPMKFWCQLVDEAEVLEDLMADIETQSSNLPAVSGVLKIGMLCIAQYYEDEAWYRAQVKSYQPENAYEVFFVDYGNSEIVSMSQIRTMPEQFVEISPQCFECTLQNTPSNVTPEMTTLFRGTVDEAEEITAKIEKVSSTGYTVTLLYDKDDQEMNISEMLFGVKEDVEMSATMKEPPQFLPPDVPLGLQDGYVCIVNSPQDFFIQLAGIEDALSSLSAELADICESSTKENLENFCVGYACCTKFSEDNNWYRAEITAVHDSTVDVLFVDYGNTDTVEKSTLKSLSDKHLEMPPLAIKCKLNGIVPVTDEWPEDAINTFQEMVDDSCLGITFISKDIPATVNITKDDKEITQCLVDMELASVETCTETDEAYAEDHLTAPIEDPLSSLPNDQSYPERKLSSTKLVVKICYVDSYDKFYVMPLELSTELDTVMTTLEILYATSDKTESENSNSVSPDVLEDPKTAMPCVAKYSEDGAWYRAIITDIDGDNLYVTFVDYGNSEITSLVNLRPLTPELVKIPPIALECSLFGIEAVPGQEQEITAKLEEYFVDEVELEMEICEVSPYKIRLNYNGDIASMLIKEGLADEKLLSPVDAKAVEMFADNSKMTFVDESLEYKIQISKRFITGTDTIVGNVKFCELENDLVAFHVVSTDLEDELQDLQQKLQDAYSEPPQNLPYVSCMDFCATKYMEDENWYRAQVLSFEKEKVKVRFIDYGNCETVDKSNIYELLSDFAVEPQFSVKCILFGLKVNKSKEVELQNRLDEYVYHESVKLKLCKYSHAICDPCITNVICGDVDISELILNEMLVSQQFIVNTQIDSRFKATVKKIECGVIYVLPSHLVEKREKFQCKLQEVCEDLSALSSEVVSDYLYAAKIDGYWHRVSVIDTANITVNVVDFGSSKNVSKSDLVLLPVDFSHQSLFLLPCTIDCSETSDANKIGIEDLNVGALISCELLKIASNVKPLKIKVLGIHSDSNIDRNVQDMKDIETSNVTCIVEDVKEAKTSLVCNVDEQLVSDVTCIKEDVKETETSLLHNVDELLVSDVTCIKEDVKETETSPLHNVDEQLLSDVTCIKEDVKEAETSPLHNVDEQFLSDVTCIKEDVKEAETSPLHNVDEQLLSDVTCIKEDVKEAETSPLHNVDEQLVSDITCIKDDVEETQTSPLHNVDEQLVSDITCIKDDVEETQTSPLHNVDEQLVSDITCIKDDVEETQTSPLHNVDEQLVSDVTCIKDDIEETESSLLHNVDEQTDSDVRDEKDQEEFVETEDKYLGVKPKSSEEEMKFSYECNSMLEDVKDNPVVADVDDQQEEFFEAESENNEEKFVEESNQQEEEIPCEKNILNSLVAEKDDFDDAELNNLVKSIDMHEIQKNFEEEDFDIQNTVVGESQNHVSEIPNEDDETNIFNTKSNLEEKSVDNVQNVNFDKVQTEEKNNFSASSNLTGAEQDNSNVNNIDSFDLQSEKSEVHFDTKDCSEEQLISNDLKCLDSPTQIADNVENETKDNKVEQIAIEEKHVNVSGVQHNNNIDDSFSTKSSPDKEAGSGDKSLPDSVVPESKSIEIAECENFENSLENFEDKNNRTIQDHYHLSGSVQVQVSDIAVSDGSVIFAVQPANLQEDFSQLKESMQSHYSPESACLDDSIETSFCAVLYESEWCRGKILQKADDSWTIMLIDYGKCVSLDDSNVKSLDSEHCNLSPFAVWCTLASAVCSSEKSENLIEFLYDTVKDSNAVIKIIEGGEPYKINLFVNESNILNQLLSDGLVTQKLPDLYIQPGSYEARLSFINIIPDALEMFINIRPFIDEYNTLTESMQQSYDVKNSVSRIVESCLCAVYHKSSWSRGIVLSSGDEKQVYLLDVGETVTNSTSLCFLLPEHCQQPSYAIPCHLPFSNSITNSDVSEFLKNILMSKEFLVDIEVCPDTNTVSAVLTDELVISELKSLQLLCNDVAESESNVESNIDLEGTSLKNSPTKSSTTVKVPEQESSERLVGYLEETFTTKPL